MIKGVNGSCVHAYKKAVDPFKFLLPGRKETFLAQKRPMRKPFRSALLKQTLGGGLLPHLILKSDFLQPATSTAAAAVASAIIRSHFEHNFSLFLLFHSVSSRRPNAVSTRESQLFPAMIKITIEMPGEDKTSISIECDCERDRASGRADIRSDYLCIVQRDEPWAPPSAFASI